MVDAVESFTVVYSYCCGAEGRFVLIKALGYGCCEGEECRCGGVKLLETMLRGVVWQCCV